MKAVVINHGFFCTQFPPVDIIPNKCNKHIL